MEHCIQDFLEQLPNLPDADVAGGGKESNTVLRVWGEPVRYDFTPRDHLSLAADLGLIDFERGVKIAGNGFWVYRGAGALLELALINYCISRNVAAGYELLLLPHIVNWDCGYVSGQFPKFGQDVYRLTGDGTGEAAAATGDRDGHVLIPTAETALAALHKDEILDAATLPRKYCAFTPCYRREAGSYRTHDRGTIRGHQFHKVELFQFVAPEQSEAALDSMLEQAESLVRDLGLHYRVSQLAAGRLQRRGRQDLRRGGVDPEHAELRGGELGLQHPRVPGAPRPDPAARPGRHLARAHPQRFRPGHQPPAAGLAGDLPACRRHGGGPRGAAALHRPDHARRRALSRRPRLADVVPRKLRQQSAVRAPQSSSTRLTSRSSTPLALRDGQIHSSICLMIQMVR